MYSARYRQLYVFFIVLIIAFVCLGLTPARAAQPERMALIIGNAQYKNSPLNNPENDANAMANSLEEVGFKVTVHTNLDQLGMKKAIDKFGKSLPKDGVALFYFAGHGIQVGGHNYLIPVNTGIKAEEDVEYEAVRADRILAKMEAARTSVNIVILDACRNNPFARSFRSGSQGLAHMDAPGGTLIAYATAPGSVASDGPGANGLYTQELIKHIQTPGLAIEEVFKRVRAGVRSLSKNQQTPWESSSLVGNFEFKAGTTPVAKPSQSQPAPTPTVPAMPRAVYGQVVASSNVDKAEFNLAGRNFTTTTGKKINIDKVPVGPHTITVHKDGYYTWQSTIFVESGKTAKLDIHLTPSTQTPSTQPSTQPTPPTTTTSTPSRPQTPSPPPTTSGYRSLRDPLLGFGLTVPESWITQNFNEQGDQIITALSPDQNVAVRVRGFRIAGGATVEAIRLTFENMLQNNLLQQTGQMLQVQPYTMSGLTGQTATYSGTMNGINVGIAAFYAIHGQTGYVVWVIIPAHLYDQRLAEADAVARTFTPGP
jgi:hypothetical protein